MLGYGIMQDEGGDCAGSARTLAPYDRHHPAHGQRDRSSDDGGARSGFGNDGEVWNRAQRDAAGMARGNGKVAKGIVCAARVTHGHDY